MPPLVRRLSPLTQLTVLAALFIAVGLAVGIWAMSDKNAPQSEAGTKRTIGRPSGNLQADQGAMGGVHDRTGSADQLPLGAVTEGNITIDDDLTTAVFSPYSGRVARLFARLGDRVEAGAPLFAVEASEFVQAVNDLITAPPISEPPGAQLSQATTNEKRAHELYLAKGGALKEWQQSQTDLATAQNAVRAAEIALAAVRNRLRILGKSDLEIAALETQPTQKLDPLAVVTAPIAGTVTQRRIGLGQYIQSGGDNPVYTIGDLSTLWLVANVREVDAPLMRVGAPVAVRVPAYPERVFDATIHGSPRRSIQRRTACRCAPKSPTPTAR